MNSPKLLNYETRPYKFTERKMLLSSLIKLSNYFGGNYQYIGLGGLAFTDFKLFHKELHIDNLYSIEGGTFNKERLFYNSPYPFIKILKKDSTSALNDINLDKKSLVWLDYDGVLDNYIFADINKLFSKLPNGSIYIVTCNRELKSSDTGEEYTKEQFSDKFGNIVPFDIKNEDFSSTKNYKTINRMITTQIKKTITDRNLTNENKLIFYKLYDLLYQENRGAKMYTYGGVIADESFSRDKAGLNIFDFVSDNDTYKIDIPNLTRKEIELTEKHLFTDEDDLLSMNIISESDLKKYKKVYKYIPHFYDVRI